MEGVWKDINLSSLHQHQTATDDHLLQGIFLQDFLAQPFNKNPIPKHGDSDHELSSAVDGGATFCAATALSLNSESVMIRSNPQSNIHASVGTTSFVSSSSSQLDALPSSSPAFFASFCKKRAPQVDDHGDDGGGDSIDRRHKRMIKNRDSASRSRARKQAYTSELENEVVHLMEENAKLRRQLEKSHFADPVQLPKKPKLYRTLTAPF